MAEANILQEGMDRVQGAVKEIDKRYQKLSKQADKRRREFERAAEKRVKDIQTGIRKSPIVKRAEGLRERAEEIREGAGRRIEEQVDQVLATFRIASQGEVERLERKVSQLTRKLRELERSHAA